MKMFYPSVRKNNWKITLGVHPLLLRRFHLRPLLNPLPIIRMDPSENIRPTGFYFSRVTLINAKELLRPENSVGPHIPSPTSTPGHSLRFHQIAFAPPERLFRAPAFGDFRRAAHELRQFSGRAYNRMANRVDVFDRAVRQKDSEFHIVFRLFSDGSLDDLLPPGSILGMNALEPLFPTWHALFWMEAIDPIPFLGQMQGVSSGNLPDPTCGMREPLGFRKIGLAVLQSLIDRTQSSRRIVEHLAKLREFVPADHRNLMLKLASGQGLRAFHKQPKRLRNATGDSQSEECRNE